MYNIKALELRYELVLCLIILFYAFILVKFNYFSKKLLREIRNHLEFFRKIIE